MNAEYTGKQIAQRRKALGLTQKGLAERLSVTDKAVSKWERGLNFPDLGLMEELAAALDTTPAALLGLEHADQNEIVSSMAEISNAQLENAHRDIRQIGWISIGSAVVLVIAYILFGNDVKRTQTAYQLLHSIIMLFAIGGIYVLVKYGEIRKWNTGDWLVCYGAAMPVLIWNGIFFFTGYSPNDVLSLCLAAIAVSMTQLLFFRIMRPKLMKALPLLLSAAFVVWMLWCGNSPIVAAIAAACCFIVWLICMLKKPLR